ncbi:histidine kinase dimerization/phosphoacceptor domain -containing protein [Nostoc sp. FACHB-145]|uniref:PAS domain-containing sensor histidine kinase n=2 Tax=unclassified Nostoc TaxID=2593658 RepID=UPI001F553C34|nr:histidine kinase dimerization/phosphoacceptor domain -containing protein [Nostoc sp. FACHB-145]
MNSFNVKLDLTENFNNCMNDNFLFTHNPLPMWIYDTDNLQFLNVNEAAINKYAYSKTEFLQMKVTDIHSAEYRQQFLKNIATSQKNISFNSQCQHYCKDGKIINVEIFTHFIEYESKNAHLVYIKDITEDIETKLLEQNEVLQSLLNQLPLMIALINTAGKLQWANQEWERVTNWNIQDLQSRDLLSELYPEPQDRQNALDFIQSAKSSWADFRTQVRDGQIIDTSWTNIKLPNGQIMGIGQEITERKQIERTLKTQLEREQLIRTVMQRIHQSLNLQDILNTIVEEVRHLLQVERVLVYQFAPDMSGKVVAESVEAGWTTSLDIQIEDTCFRDGAGVEYYQGRKRAIPNIYEAGLTPCHIKLLERFDVKANLIVPILLEVGEDNPSSRLWGLLIAHQCVRFREWEENQLDLLDQLSVTIAIAIQQSTIFQQAQNELAERQKAELQLRSALAEKEVLLKEVHHRVKNNLQIVSSLLQLQTHTLKDPEVIKIFRESQNRIESICLIHKNLYTTQNIGQLDVVDYIQNLANNIMLSYRLGPESIELVTNIEAVSLNVDQAIACGLIINELISNSLKHAFPDGQKGTISINLHTVGGDIEMSVIDDGIGIPDDLDWNNTESLGLSLVSDLVTEQLEGSITLERHHGTMFKIQFPQLTLQ